MVRNPSNNNKANNRLSPQSVEHQKDDGISRFNSNTEINKQQMGRFPWLILG
jgi:hypothetical protein